MRLFQRKNVYYIEFYRKRISLKTSDFSKAQLLYNIAMAQSSRGEDINLDMTNMSFNDYFSRFIKLKEIELLSIDTLNQYDLVSRLFIESVGNVRLNDITRDTITIFIKTCLGRGCKPISVNSYLRGVRAVLNSAYEENFLQKKLKIKMIKNGKRFPKIFSPAEITKIINHSKKFDLDMYRVIIFAYFTGCRRSEILNLKYSQIHDSFARIIGKGNKERFVPLHDFALKVCGAGNPKENVFFQCHSDTYTHRFKSICVRLGIYDRGFHSLRHTAATSMIEKGIKLSVIQKILGHASITTTQIYTDIGSSLLLSEIQKLTPVLE